MQNYLETVGARKKESRRNRVAVALVPQPSGTIMRTSIIARRVNLHPHQVGQYIRGLADEKGIEPVGKGLWRWK